MIDHQYYLVLEGPAPSLLRRRLLGGGDGVGGIIVLFLWLLRLWMLLLLRLRLLILLLLLLLLLLLFPLGPQKFRVGLGLQDWPFHNLQECGVIRAGWRRQRQVVLVHIARTIVVVTAGVARVTVPVLWISPRTHGGYGREGERENLKSAVQ